MRRAVDNQTRLTTEGPDLVGVDSHTDDVFPWEIDGFAGGSDAWERGVERVATLRAERNERAAGEALRALEEACRDGSNVVPLMIDAVDADVTVGEVGAVYREVFGTWDVPVEL